MEFCRSSIWIPLFLLVTPQLTSCANAPKSFDAKVGEGNADTAQSTPPTAPATPSSDEPSPQEQMQRMREKILDLETRISALNEKINLENGTKAPSELPTQAAQPPVAAAKVIPASKTSAKFTNDENIDRYREAKILMDSERFADATVEFVNFTKESPDHALAPAAQYFVGVGYFKQKEYQRAEEEWNRGLMAYPHSNYVPDTLLSLMEVSQVLKKASRVTYYQQKLIGTFPNSPQAMKAALIKNRPQTSDTSETTRNIDRPLAPEAPEPPTQPESASPPSGANP